MSSRNSASTISVLNFPLSLGDQILLRIASRVVLSSLKFLAARFRAHSITRTARMQTRASVYFDLHFSTANAAILDKLAVKAHCNCLQRAQDLLPNENLSLSVERNQMKSNRPKIDADRSDIHAACYGQQSWNLAAIGRKVLDLKCTKRETS